jgi:hypothetical protein
VKSNSGSSPSTSITPPNDAGASRPSYTPRYVPVAVVPPAGQGAVAPDPTGMIFTRADLGELARGGRGLPGVVSSAGRLLARGPLRPGAILVRCPDGLAWPALAPRLRVLRAQRSFLLLAPGRHAGDAALRLLRRPRRDDGHGRRGAPGGPLCRPRLPRSSHETARSASVTRRTHGSGEGTSAAPPGDPGTSSRDG